MNHHDLLAYEEGELQEKEVIALFQQLIDDGTVWTLPGSYGRTAMSLIESGHCTLGPTGHRDAYGNYVPARHEVKSGTKGSPEYCENKATERENN